MRKLIEKIIKKTPLLGKVISERNALRTERDFLLREIEDKKDYCSLFLSPWTDTWKDFYVQNYTSINSKVNALKVGLDEESKKVIDTFLEKIFFLIPYNRYKQAYLYKYSEFFSQEEIKEQKKDIDISKYKFPDGVDIDKAVFKTENGLSFLDKTAIIKNIKGKSIIDGGGYIGDSALVFCKYNPLKIYSFEPINYLYKKLKETLRLNNIEHLVEPVKLGLSNKEKETRIYDKGSCSSLYPVSKEFQVIKTTTIDKFVRDKKVKVGLIKLDIEGSELEAIRGSLETIKNDKPILLVSIYHRPEDFFFIKPLIERLNLGYKFVIRKTSPFRVTSETMLIGYVD